MKNGKDKGICEENVLVDWGHLNTTIFTISIFSFTIFTNPP